MIKSDNLQMRAAKKQDIPAMKALLDAVELFPSHMLDNMISAYLHGSSQDIWFVCIYENQLIAFGFCEPERMTEGTWNLLALGVLPDYQGVGVGTAMMSYIEEQLRQQEERILLVETMGIPEFRETRKFYAKAGYDEEARIREFYEKGADKVIFWKQL